MCPQFRHTPDACPPALADAGACALGAAALCVGDTLQLAVDVHSALPQPLALHRAGLTLSLLHKAPWLVPDLGAFAGRHSLSAAGGAAGAWGGEAAPGGAAHRSPRISSGGAQRSPGGRFSGFTGGRRASLRVPCSAVPGSGVAPGGPIRCP